MSGTTTYRFKIDDRVFAELGPNRTYGVVVGLDGVGRDGVPFCGQHNGAAGACPGPFYMVRLDGDDPLCYAEHELTAAPGPFVYWVGQEDGGNG